MPNDGMGPRHSIRIGSMIKFKITVKTITIWTHLTVTFKDIMTLLLDPKTFF